MRFLSSLLINGLVIYTCSIILPGISVSGFVDAVVVALLLGIVNFFVKPFIILLTLPITIFTLGLFLLVVNGIMVMIVDGMMDGFSVAGLSSAVLLSIILCIANYFNSRYEKG